MPYASLAEFRALFSQIESGASIDSLITNILTRTTDQIDKALGFSFAAYGSASNKDVRAFNVGRWLPISYHNAGSITAVSQVTSYGTSSEITSSITDYADFTDDDNMLYLYRELVWPNSWYRINAIWGYGDAPESVKQLNLQLAGNEWRSKDRGYFSDAIGVDGNGEVIIVPTLTQQQKALIVTLRRKYLGIGKRV